MSLKLQFWVGEGKKKNKTRTKQEGLRCGGPPRKVPRGSKKKSWALGRVNTEKPTEVGPRKKWLGG